MSGSEVDNLMIEFCERGASRFIFGPAAEPYAIAFALRWTTGADVVVLLDEDDATAYRLPTCLPHTDIFVPETVFWHYHSTALSTLRAVLDLPPPGSPGAPIALLRPPPNCGIPPQLRGQLHLPRIQPEAPGQCR